MPNLNRNTIVNRVKNLILEMILMLFRNPLQNVILKLFKNPIRSQVKPLVEAERDPWWWNRSVPG